VAADLIRLAVTLFCALSAYALLTYAFGAACGIIAEEVAVGFGPALVHWKYRATDFYIRPLLLGSLVRFPNDNERASEQRCKTFDELGLREKLIVLLTAHFATMLIGLAIAWIARGQRDWLQVGLFVVAMQLLNFVPIPNMSGGRAILEIVAAWQGSTVTVIFFDRPYAIRIMLACMAVSLGGFFAVVYVFLFRFDSVLNFLRSYGLLG
jgi:membrane-associated protease RseP (regulator of RpoE activity)